MPGRKLGEEDGAGVGGDATRGWGTYPLIVDVLQRHNYRRML